MKTLPTVDVVIVGGGWSGLLMAKEIGSRTPHSVVVLERGKARNTSDYISGMDEVDYGIRFRMMQDYSEETITFRHSISGKALPVRQHGSFLPGNGVGGAGEHWNGNCPRPLPDTFEILSKTVEKYGLKKLPEDHALQNWGVTYDELEPYYTRVERLLGASGKAGNIGGTKIEGGNVFEGWRSMEYPTPPLKIPYFSVLFRDAANSLGYHPYPAPAANLSEAYTNPDGVSRAGCAYCGYCERFGCMIGAKAQPTNTLLPVIEKYRNVSIRTGAHVRHLNREGNQVRGVVYTDAKGEEIFQPADLVILASWVINNTRLLLLSGIGEPYNPATGRGTVGRNLTHQVSTAVTALFDKPLNGFMGSGASGIFVSDLNGDIFDHSELPFLRGGVLEGNAHGNRPIANFGAVPSSVKARWGSDWKNAAVRYFDRTGHISFDGEHLPYKGNYMDLDPVYKDRYGDPLVRMTLDWRENERRMVEFAGAKAAEIGRAMGAKEIISPPALGRYDAQRYQPTHIQGGTIMGKSSVDSVVNTFWQNWQVSNLFVLGASAFPHESAAHPTLTVLALALRSADAIVQKYLKKPGPLA